MDSMMLNPNQYGLGIVSGALVGFVLGLFGGGGSVIAVPLMIYVVGIQNMHVAIGTSAFAVASNAATCAIGHARAGVVRWRFAGVYSLAGIAGALAGSIIGKVIDGRKLLLLFALLMLAVGILMFRARGRQGNSAARCTRENIPKVLSFGAMTGALSGFFGIGGGFLIVPGLVASTGMPIINAIGSSLVAVCAFGLTTSLSYAYSGLVNWPLATVFIGGGLVGGRIGSRLARRLSSSKGLLNVLFAVLIVVVACYMIVRSLQAAI